MNNYTKQDFINGSFVLINDHSKELKQLINSWFPDDLLDEYDISGVMREYVVFANGHWFFDTSNFRRPAIKASEITEERVIMGSELQVYCNDRWIDAYSSIKLRFKPKLDPRISEMIGEAKKMGYKITFEKLT